MEQNKQIGGTHYRQRKREPFELMAEISANAFVGNVIKYVDRHPFKNNAQDIHKAIQTIAKAKQYNSQQVWVADAIKKILAYCDDNELGDNERNAIIAAYYNEYDRAIEHLCNIVQFVYPCNVPDCLFYDNGDCVATNTKCSPKAVKIHNNKKKGDK